MNQSIIVRQMSMEDVSCYIKEISNFIFESTRMSNYEDSYTRENAVAKAEELRLYVEHNQAIVIGAYDANDMVGFLWAYMFPYREDMNRIYLSILHVLEEYREHKIGTKLVEALEAIAQDRKVDKIYLHAEASSKQACGFYESRNYIKERIQYVKKIDHSCVQDVGGVLRGDVAILLNNKNQFIDLYYENVKSHEYEKCFIRADAAKKIDTLIDYIDQKKAYLFYTKNDDTISSFIWLHPIMYMGKNRIYIHAYIVDERYRMKGLASKLYEEILRFPFDTNEIYTHVDVSNQASCYIQEKYGFIAEKIQYCKVVK